MTNRDWVRCFFLDIMCQTWSEFKSTATPQSIEGHSFDLLRLYLLQQNSEKIQLLQCLTVVVPDFNQLLIVIFGQINYLILVTRTQYYYAIPKLNSNA